MRDTMLILTMLLGISLYSQSTNKHVLTLSEYLSFVKQYHPVVKQSQLIVTEGELKLLKSRGAFDPKLDIDYNRKKFKDTDYYNQLNAVFKIPTWYGINFKANYEKNSGTYLNPQLKVPKDGLYGVGVSVSLAKGLLTNDRMATLKKAKLYTQQAKAEQSLLVNHILYNAINTYFNWLKNYQINKTYNTYLKNAEVRFNNTKKSFIAGDKPAIDTLEAKINLKSRTLDLEKSKIGYLKSKLEVANYLWIANNIPLELETHVIPDINTSESLDGILGSAILNYNNDSLEEHPKLQALQFKKDILTIDKRLKLNNVLPKIDAQYQFLTSDYTQFNTLNTSNYKGGLTIRIPLFLRKERADLRLAKLKLQNIDFEIASNKVNLSNKIKGSQNEIDSYNLQRNILLDLVTDYKKLVSAEERKFVLGEGSIFLVNYREIKLIETQLKLIDTEYKYLNSKAYFTQLINNLI